MSERNELMEDAHTRAFVVAASTDPRHLRQALVLLDLLHGVALTEAKAILEMAFGLALASTAIDSRDAGLKRIHSWLDQTAKADAEAVRRAAYLDKARADPALKSRLRELADGRASGPSLEQLEAEFGRNFVS